MMTSFGWWAAHAGPGHFMCQVCYSSRHVSEAWEDEAGTKWDVCEPCKAIEWAIVRERDLKDEITELVDEVKDADRRAGDADLRAEEWKAQSMSLARRLNETVDENVDLRAQLALADERRTTGGVPRGLTPNWSAVAKLNGNMPPPYTPKSEDKS